MGHATVFRHGAQFSEIVYICVDCFAAEIFEKRFHPIARKNTNIPVFPHCVLFFSTLVHVSGNQVAWRFDGRGVQAKSGSNLNNPTT